MTPKTIIVPPPGQMVTFDPATGDSVVEPVNARMAGSFDRLREILLIELEMQAVRTSEGAMSRLEIESRLASLQARLDYLQR